MNGKLSAILPATDEPHSLTKTVELIKQFVPNRPLQLIIVTHPKLTTPECNAAIEELKKKYADVESFVQTSPGIGGAIQESFARANGEYTALMSADLETDPAVLPLLLEAVERGADIAVTTRWKRGIRFDGYNPIKLVLNFGFQQFFRALYLTRLSDLTYAYRVYRTPIVKKIKWEETGFPFLFESILKPLRLGYRVVEVQALWAARTEGMSHNSFKQTAKYFLTGIRVRFQSKKKMLRGE